MSSSKKVLLSGVKPSGRPHLGNYFGAMRQFVDLQDKYESFFMIADYHALNHVQNGKEMSSLIRELLLDYLAVGLNPKKCVIFQQSSVPEHTELAWIFDTITTMPYLMRAHAFKDAEAKNKEISVGTFNYPMLMAADILLYDPEVVPVGADQKQHVEYARDTALKFNHIFGEVFSLPQALILEDVATVPGTDGRKMSKSYGNTIPLFGSRAEIEKAVMGIVTDSVGERPENVYALHKLFKPEVELLPIYEKYRGNYRALKEMLLEEVESMVAPMREGRAAYQESGKLESILNEGMERARERAKKKMRKVRETVGVSVKF